MVNDFVRNCSNNLVKRINPMKSRILRLANVIMFLVAVENCEKYSIVYKTVRYSVVLRKIFVLSTASSHYSGSEIFFSSFIFWD